jgi:hypothetical protein
MKPRKDKPREPLTALNLRKALTPKVKPIRTNMQ